jgi:hypothetical protein
VELRSALKRDDCGRRSGCVIAREAKQYSSLSWIASSLALLAMTDTDTDFVPYRASVSTASSYFPEPIPVSAKMP